LIRVNPRSIPTSQDPNPLPSNRSAKKRILRLSAKRILLMKPQCLTVAALFLSLFVATARAQIGIYAGFTGAHLNASSSTTLYGPLVGVYAQSGRFLALGADVRGAFYHRNGIQYYTGAIGPRVAFKLSILPIKPYVEGLVGLASYTPGSSSSSSTHLNYQILGGIDATILPRIDWRVIEFGYSALVGNSVDAKTLSTGIVFRLP
jgi:hypothetical protein